MLDFDALEAMLVVSGLSVKVMIEVICCSHEYFFYFVFGGRLDHHCLVMLVKQLQIALSVRLNYTILRGVNYCRIKSCIRHSSSPAYNSSIRPVHRASRLISEINCL